MNEIPDEPEPEETAEGCPVCDGEGCVECNFTGQIDLREQARARALRRAELRDDE